MNRTKITLSMCFLFLVGLHLQVFAECTVPSDICEYVPLVVGNYWTFEKTDPPGEDEKWIQTIFGTQLINGQLQFQFSNWEKGIGYVLFTCNDVGLKALSINGDNNIPACPGPLILDCGETLCGESRFSFETIPGCIATPAGSFCEVIKMNHEIFHDGEQQYILTAETFFAKGVGQIKFIDYLSRDGSGTYLSTYELISNGTQDSTSCPADLNKDGVADGSDLAIFAAGFGGICP